MLAWLYWDPPQELFTIPFIHHPLRWYGVCFALGFLLGYRVIVYFFKRYLCKYPFFGSGDIDWPLLIDALKKKEENLGGKVMRDLFFKLDVQTQKEILRLSEGKGLAKSLKMKVVQVLNGLLKDPIYYKSLEFAQDREIKGMRGVEEFAKKNLSEEEWNFLERRLLFEKVFPEAFLGLPKRASQFCEKVAIYVMVGTVLGARLGHLLFYESWEWITRDPLAIVRTWEGGLASHGAVMGILAALTVLFYRSRENYRQMRWLTLVDLLVIPCSIGAVLIRIGNFVNQEVLGKATSLAWGVVFLRPADGAAVVPRHPAQLYEAGFYLMAFVFLFWLWKTRIFVWRPGKLAGLFFCLFFIFRFFIEFLKEEQSQLLSGSSGLVMGQYLSIPMILLGLALYFKKFKRWSAY